MRSRCLFCLLLAMVCCCIVCKADHHKLPDKYARLDSCMSLLERNNYNEALTLSKTMLSEANEDKDARLCAYAQYCQGMALLMTGHPEEASLILQKAKMTGDNLGNDSIQALALNGMGVYVITGKSNTYLAERYFRWARQKAEAAHYNSALARINCNLAGLLFLKSDSTGIEYAHEALEQANRSGTKGISALALMQLAKYNKVFGRYDEAERNIKQSISLQREIHASAATSLVVYADMLFEQENDEKALMLLKEALYEAMTEENQTSALPGVYLCYAVYYHNQGDYKLSNDYAQRCYEAAHGRSLSSYDQRCLSLISENYERMGQTNQALSYLKRYNQVNESIEQADKQRAELDAQTLVDMEKSEREAKYQRQRYENEVQKNIILALFAAFLLVAIAVLWRLFHTRSRLYKKIVEQFNQAKERENYLREQLQEVQHPAMKAQAEQSPPKQPSDDDEKTKNSSMSDDTAKRLYADICQLMEQERLYADLQLSRDMLADRLGTNRTYVTQVINERTGLNFSQFVNRYRINEAQRILSDPAQANYPIKQLCTDLGFNSITAFYSTFRSNVGMAPATYRKTALAI